MPDRTGRYLSMRSAVVFLAVLLICLIAYWEIPFLQDSLVWDMLDCYYPWRYFVGECVQYRVWPFWNPYQDMGYPIFADLRSVIYPEPLLVGIFGGYTLAIFHWLFIGYLAMAGSGMYRLLGLFVKNDAVRLTLACAYPICGFFVGHGQDIAAIIAATWIPWSLFYFIRLQTRLKTGDIWKLSVFLFLLMTGGYQALNLIFIYLLLILGLWHFGKRLFQNDRSSLWRMTLINVVLVAVTVGAILILVVTYLEVSPQVGRLSGLTLQQVYVNLLNPRALMSFLVPFSSTVREGLDNADITMSNAYVGLIVIIFFLAGLTQRKNATTNIILVFGFICLLASLGQYTPVRKFLFDHVPGMNLFRMCSYFSYFMQLAMFIVAAIGMEKILKQPDRMRKPLLISIGMVATVLLTSMVIVYVQDPKLGGQVFSHLFDNRWLRSTLSFGQTVLLHGCIQLGVLLILTVSFLLLRNRSGLKVAMFLLVLVEMTLSVRLNFPYTVGGGHNVQEMQAAIERQPKGFPIPDLNRAVRWNKEARPQVSPLYHNTDIFTKNISPYGFNSFKLRAYDWFENRTPKAFEAALRHPILYASDSSRTKLQIVDYEPTRLVCKVTADRRDSITFQQTFYTGWRAYVNGTPTTMTLRKGTFPIITVPSGESEVIFRYRNPKALAAFTVSYGVVVCLLGLILFGFFRNNGLSYLASVGGVALTGLIGVAIFGFCWSKTITMKDLRLNRYMELVEAIKKADLKDNTVLVLHVDQSSLMDSLLHADHIQNKTVYTWNAGGPQFRRLKQFSTDSVNHVVYAGWNQEEDKTVIELLRQHWPKQEKLSVSHGFIYRFAPGSAKKALYYTSTDLEADNGAWRYKLIDADTSVAKSGKRSWPITPEQMGSPPYSIRVNEDFPKGHLHFVFEAWCRIPDPMTGFSNMFIEIERQGKTFWSAAACLNEMAKGNSDWFPALLLATPDFEMEEGDLIKVFVWGNDKELLYLDDLSFTIYQAEKVTAPFSE